MFEDAPAEAEAAAPSTETLVVGSKVKAYVKSKEMMSSGELIGALSDKVHDLLDAAIARTQANKRSTVKASDL